MAVAYTPSTTRQLLKSSLPAARLSEDICPYDASSHFNSIQVHARRQNTHPRIRTHARTHTHTRTRTRTHTHTHTHTHTFLSPLPSFAQACICNFRQYSRSLGPRTLSRCQLLCNPLHTYAHQCGPGAVPDAHRPAAAPRHPLSFDHTQVNTLHTPGGAAHAFSNLVRTPHAFPALPTPPSCVCPPAARTPSYSRTRTARSPSWSDSISSGHAHNRPQEPTASHPWPSLPRTHVHRCSPALAPPPTCTRWRQPVTRHLRATHAEPPPHALRLRACVFTCTTGSRPSDRRPFPPYMPCAPAQHLHLTAPAHLSALPSLAVHQNAPASHGVAHSARTAAAHKEPKRTDVKRW